MGKFNFVNANETESSSSESKQIPASGSDTHMCSAQEKELYFAMKRLYAFLGNVAT